MGERRVRARWWGAQTDRARRSGQRVDFSIGRAQIRRMTDPGSRGEQEQHDHTERRDLRRALTFGVVLATIEMAVVLALLYC
jgi:hypothetical protein